MSLEHYQKIGVRLYYYILKLHRSKLSPELRSLGDKYVQTEFRAHQKANEDQYKEFLGAWMEYYRTVSQTQDVKEIGRNIDPETWAYFSDEQKGALKTLKDYTFSKKK